jgi:hypothetical protein
MTATERRIIVWVDLNMAEESDEVDGCFDDTVDTRDAGMCKECKLDGR